MEKKKENFTNFWSFLGLPMNSPLKDIKLAYANKFSEIEKALDNGDTSLYSANDLITTNQAYETLSDPYKRFLHNCEIDGEDPDDIFDYDPEEETRSDNEQDLTDDENEIFSAWLKAKMNEYYETCRKHGRVVAESTWNVPIIVFKDIAMGLANNYIQLEEQLEKKRKTTKRRFNSL